MAIYYLIRHGEADYSDMMDKGFWGFGRSFAPLSQNGIAQAEATANDVRLKSAAFIVSSPYTRALQTAAIISRETGLNINMLTTTKSFLSDTVWRLGRSLILSK